MAETQDEIQFNTPVGAIRAHGFNVIIVLALVILSWLTFTEHKQRSDEHDAIIKADAAVQAAIINTLNYNACLQRVNLFVLTAKDPTKVSLNAMPPELWVCLPRFMTEEQQAERKQREAR